MHTYRAKRHRKLLRAMSVLMVLLPLALGLTLGMVSCGDALADAAERDSSLRLELLQEDIRVEIANGRALQAQHDRLVPVRKVTRPKAAKAVLRRDHLGTFQSTAYCLTGTTASGKQAGPGRIAVDPRVIPLGTRLYVEGYGECVAVDTGGAIKGRIIDVWFASETRCMQWGRRSVKVYRLN